MKFVKIYKKELKNIVKEHKGCSIYWKNNDISGLFKIVEGKEIVGLISMRNKKNCLFINMIEIFEKNKGYGGEAVSALKKISTKDIRGIPVTEAETFWQRNGAKFDKSIYFTIKKQKEI